MQTLKLHRSIWHLLMQAHVKNAEKYLKTSPLKLKFTPEWDPAGDEFSRAATAYKVALIKMRVRMLKMERSAGCQRRVCEMFSQWLKEVFWCLWHKVAKKYSESKKCLLRAVDCYKEIHSIFQASWSSSWRWQRYQYEGKEILTVFYQTTNNVILPCPALVL